MSYIGNDLATDQVFLPDGTGAVSRTIPSKLKDTVSVKDFGAVGDGATNDSPAVQAAVDYLLANNGNTLYFPNGTYYLNTTISVKFETSKSLRLAGTSSAGFTGVRPGGSLITGASGLAALFLLTKTNPATGGGFAFECEHLDFDGNSKVVVSAIKNVLGGFPARPFVIRSCNFTGFQKALSCDITSGTVNDTGISTASITDSSFTGNGAAIWGAGNGSWMNLAFERNVCEQNTSGIISSTGYFGGTFFVADCLLEGQPDTINIQGGLINAEVTRNYFEANSGYLMSFSCVNGDSTINVKNNYILNCSGALASFSNCVLDCTENFEAAGVKLQVNLLSGKSRISNLGTLYTNYLPNTNISLAYDSINALSSNSNVTNGQFVTFSTTAAVVTPKGQYGYATVNGYGGIYNYLQSVNTGDWVVAIALCRNTAATSVPIYLTLYDNSTSYIGNSEPTATGGPVALGEWYTVIRVVRTTGPSTGVTKFRWTTTGPVEVTDTYVYKITSPTLTTPIPFFFPFPTVGRLNNIEILNGKSYGLTSTSGSTTAIVDTGLYSNTDGLGYQNSTYTGAVYNIILSALPNASGNVSSNTVIGNIIVGVNVSNLFEIKYADVFNPAMTGVTPFTVSAVFWNGSTESTTNASGTTNQIRVKIAGFLNNPGYNLNLRIIKQL
jgi:hypothetical protein